jgi:hypothetical protein
MIESHRLPNGGVLILQIGPDDLIQPPEKLFERKARGDGWVVDLCLPAAPPPPPTPVKTAAQPQQGATK